MEYSTLKEENKTKANNTDANCDNASVTAMFYCGYDSLVFSWECIREIGWPKNVQVLINPEEKKMVLIPGKKNSKDEFAVPDKCDVKDSGFVLEGEQILLRFMKLMGWVENGIYEVKGYLAVENVLLFDLSSAQKKSEECGSDMDTPLSVEEMWNMIVNKEEEIFITITGVNFTYSIRDDGLYLEGRKRRILKDTIATAYKKVASGRVRYSSDLATFGETYLLTIFRKIMAQCKKK